MSSTLLPGSPTTTLWKAIGGERSCQSFMLGALSLDVHQRSVVACALLTGEDGASRHVVRTFGTMTGDLFALNDWLNGLGIEQVAMESTGVDRRRPASTGDRSSICWKRITRSSWSMHSTAKRSLDARRM